METMKWTDFLKVGHSRIDRDHQRLVGLINELGEAMTSGQGKEACGKVLEELITYTKTHFSMEEELMARHQFQGAADHKREHARLVQEVVDFQRKYEADALTLSVPLLHFLMEWLSQHILKSDKALAKGLPKE